ncbi:acetate/propionate family kinase [Maribacter sp. HTCC2170]|uniref:acetate/propionate family kinase n=1 Tax=Maribacter sp. (strain HTCC2170 / KCCM 42371) TaxID=313603 RepID=UPI00006B219B|nr:acetate kinase [Maribacter sp. HTCC2170]EAR00076.1 acetate kinase [Maribacter sp. HTCC2170]
MKVLILNSGSSSIKFQLIEMPEEKVICGGLVERIGSRDSVLVFNLSGKKHKKKLPINDHKEGLIKISNVLLDVENGILKSTEEIEAVGHRVVHGGNAFSETTLVNKEVKRIIKENFSLAPLHNPHNLLGIEIAEQIFSNSKQIAVFDTAFHQSIPTKVRKYAIPNKFYEENGIQLYGFHGTSHKYVSERAADYLGREDAKLITIHLGNGCSISAVKNGKSVDHSLGFAPSNGLIMGSRSGDIDHSIVFYLVNELGYSLDEVNNMLNKESGMLGLTGYSDLRDIESEAERGNHACKLALEMNAYRIKKYIGAYAAAMNGLDALIFTAGIGENSELIRKMVCNEMQFLEIEIDDLFNSRKSAHLREINTSDSIVKVLVIPTNEELEIAKQAFHLLEN